MQNKYKYLALSIATALLVGCGGGSSDSGDVDGQPGSGTPDGSTVTVDATSGAPTMLDLASGAVVPTEDDVWHVVYQKYVGFSTNGGASGPGSVEGCIAHEYEALFDSDGNAVESEFAALTMDNTIEQYNAVTAESCTDFETDSIKPGITTEDWYAYGSPNNIVADNAFIIRHNDGTSYSRIKVTQYYMAPDHSSYDVSLDIETWNDNTQTFDAPFSVTLPYATRNPVPQYYDVNAKQLVDSDGEWDIHYYIAGRDMMLQTNGGVSGDGNGGTAVVLLDGGASAVTDPTDTGREEGKQIYDYEADTGSGVLSEPGSFGPLQYGVAVVIKCGQRLLLT
ncbi:hypothetical protein JCM19235_6865 [Vibrio maritimus]|uniref:Lipoprotein n=1 Tax=Vibrio maritimus TaxID=990268 RepID=A0A090SFN3_9VIBR|nr:hypothetical protein JCM19235_6865 [Vibrio maritimus]